MLKFVLDGKEMYSREALHDYLEDALDLPLSYTRNLDALYDLLSTAEEPVQIDIINCQAMIDKIGFYGEQLMLVFADLQKETDKFTVRFFE